VIAGGASKIPSKLLCPSNHPTSIDRLLLNTARLQA
jgi:hypothetical protein